MSDRNRVLLRTLAPLAVMGVIFYFSSQSAAPHHAWWELVLRKLGHVTGYALLTAAWAWALQGVVRRPVVWAVAISFLYACSDEYHQTFVPGRFGSPIDVGVDSIGMALAAYLITRAARGRQLAQGVHGRVDARGGSPRSSPAR